MNSGKTYRVRFIGPFASPLVRAIQDSSRLDLRDPEDEEKVDSLLVQVRNVKEVLPKMKAAGSPKVPVIVVSSDLSSDFLAGATRAGAAGVLHPDATSDIILEALDTVTAGGTYFSATPVMDLLQKAHSREESLAKTQLTPRELSVLELLALGMSARQIATRLSLSERTVNTHVAKLYRKLGASNRVEAITTGMRMGLVIISE